MSNSNRQTKIVQIRDLPAKLEVLVKDLDDTQLDTPCGEGEWTIRQVVHHVADSHMNSYIRLKLILTERNIKETLTQPITLTDGAVKQLQRIMSEQNLSAEHGLRVGVKGGGCSGFSYILGFDAQTERPYRLERTNEAALLLRAYDDLQTY